MLAFPSFSSRDFGAQRAAACFQHSPTCPPTPQVPHPTCLVGQLEEPAPGDVDVVVGPIAVVVRGPAAVLWQLAPLLLRPTPQGVGGTGPSCPTWAPAGSPQHGERGEKSRKGGRMQGPNPAAKPVYLHQALVRPAHVPLQLAQLLHLRHREATPKRTGSGRLLKGFSYCWCLRARWGKPSPATHTRRPPPSRCHLLPHAAAVHHQQLVLHALLLRGLLPALLQPVLPAQLLDGPAHAPTLRTWPGTTAQPPQGTPCVPPHLWGQTGPSPPGGAAGRLSCRPGTR